MFAIRVWSVSSVVACASASSSKYSYWSTLMMEWIDGRAWTICHIDRWHAAASTLNCISRVELKCAYFTYIYFISFFLFKLTISCTSWVESRRARQHNYVQCNLFRIDNTDSDSHMEQQIACTTVHSHSSPGAMSRICTRYRPRASEWTNEWKY